MSYLNLYYNELNYSKDLLCDNWESNPGQLLGRQLCLLRNLANQRPPCSVRLMLSAGG